MGNCGFASISTWLNTKGIVCMIKINLALS